MTDLFHLRQGLRDPLKHALQDRAQGEDRAGPAFQRRPDHVDAGMDIGVGSCRRIWLEEWKWNKHQKIPK